jgi:hypothetical protein
MNDASAAVAYLTTGANLIRVTELVKNVIYPSCVSTSSAYCAGLKFCLHINPYNYFFPIFQCFGKSAHVTHCNFFPNMPTKKSLSHFSVFRQIFDG